MTSLLEPPVTLPVSRLSVSSLNLLAKCPERWKRRYIDREYEPSSGAAILGKSIGAAETQHYGHVIERGARLSLEDVEDEYSAQWDDYVSTEEIDWRNDKPGVLKDEGYVALGRMHTTIASKVVPTSIEREFEVTWPEVNWTLTGFIDLELADGAVADMKVRSGSRGRMSHREANTELQPTAYLYARRAEGNPAPRFEYHTAVRVKSPYAEIVPTQRTDRQLDWFEERVMTAASEIAWRTEYEKWSGAVPGTWWCSAKWCGYWPTCKFGGAR